MNKEKEYILLKTVFQGENFGSVLQAYALKNYLTDNFNANCIIIEEKAPLKHKGFYAIKRKAYNLFKSCLSIRLLKDTFSSHFNKNKNGLAYSQEIKQNFNNFIDEKLSPEYYSFNELKELAKSDKCIRCVCGSDQVWNPTGTSISKNNFLMFSKKEKNLSYAASIGSDYIPYYNHGAFKKMIKNISHISVREEKAKEVIEKKFKLNTTLCVDPVMLVGKEFWKSNLIKIEKNNYVFCYFLNKPSQKAIERIKDYSENGVEVIVVSRIDFSKYNISINQIKNISPLQFVSYIDGANEVLTDSFHGSIFSIVLQRNFLVFERDYQTSIPQNARLISILSKLGLLNRFIDGDSKVSEVQKIDYLDVEKKLIEMTEVSKNYLKVAFDK